MKKLLALTAILLAGCVHKPTIEQGNIITPAQISQLHRGMTVDQVKALLGSPILDHPFNQDRMEYIYSWQSGNNRGTGERLTLLFHDQRLSKIEHESSFLLPR